MDKLELQKIIEEHAKFTTMLYELLKSLLDSLNIKYHAIEYRTKTIDSLEEKINRKKISDIKEDITDISGIRIILYYQNDVDKVIDIVRKNFAIDRKNSMNKSGLYSSNQFGYLSVHYIVTLNDKRNTLPEWRSFSELKAEIQIRTVLQHTWASISHELIYKKNYEIPQEIERKLYRLAGLFELVDEQFLSIKEEHKLLEEKMKNKSNVKENIEINKITLRHNLHESDICNMIQRIAIGESFCYSDDCYEDKYLEQLISEMAIVTDILGYKYLYEIEDKLQLEIENIKLYFAELNKRWNDSEVDYYLILLLAMLFLLNIEQLDEFSELSGWNNRWFIITKETIIYIKDL